MVLVERTELIKTASLYALSKMCLGIQIFLQEFDKNQIKIRDQCIEFIIKIYCMFFMIVIFTAAILNII